MPEVMLLIHWEWGLEQSHPVLESTRYVKDDRSHGYHEADFLWLWLVPEPEPVLGLLVILIMIYRTFHSLYRAFMALGLIVLHKTLRYLHCCIPFLED